ncbi:site-2 protease family protein [Castellaniella sp.]|uniref:site-2 protease family protein n=1 Tax=Castellaniella sp. TaxID=1955812 RepID=UPI002AFFE338|nr:site-2 protease family protein [Castellaniella sp.]
MDQLIQTISVYAIPVLFAITLHEAAHGYVARYFGDPTAYQAGRISLNPLRHIDPMGTIVVPLVLLFVTRFMGGGLLFGWAKPVPVNWSRLRRPKQDMLWVALAGPASNLLQAIFWVLFLRVMLSAGMIEQPGSFWALMAQAGVEINLILMALNLLPLPPLDGGRIVFSLLPPRMAWQYGRIEPYGLAILIVLMVMGWLWPLMTPLLQFGQWVVRGFL